MYQAEFISKGSLSKDSRLKVLSRRAMSGSNSLLVWLTENYSKRWPKLSKVAIDPRTLFIYCRGGYPKV